MKAARRPGAAWLRRRCIGTSALLAALAVGSHASAQADDVHRLRWQSNWRRVGGIEYAVTTGLLGTFVGVWFLSPAAEPVWTRPVLFDELTRDALRAESPGARNVAAHISDGVIIVSYLPPLIIDPLVVAGLDDQNPDVAWQLFVISTQSYSLTIVLNAVSKRIFARERPYASACAKDPTYSVSCEHADRFRSFYSGHSAVTATGAGLVCAHHTHLPLYGGGNIDRFTCLGALIGTLATGALRIISDRHWASDVLVGHLLGLSSGYLLPTLIYYKSFQTKPDPRDSEVSAPLSTGAVPLVAWSTAF
jgi:membrane-associated phospholipid phosphatase